MRKWTYVLTLEVEAINALGMRKEFFRDWAIKKETRRQCHGMPEKTAPHRIYRHCIANLAAHLDGVKKKEKKTKHRYRETASAFSDVGRIPDW